MRLLRLGRVEPGASQALYHAIAETMSAETADTLIICQPRSSYLSLGYHQIHDAVLRVDEVKRRRLPVFRRRVGGGLTYLDCDQLFYQCIFHRSRLASGARSIYSKLLAAPVATLRRLGLDATLRADNEIEVEGRRVAGVGGARLGEANVVVGNLLVDFDFETLAAVWRTPSVGFREHGLRAMRARMTTLREHLGRVSMSDLEQVLIDEFATALQRPLQPSLPTAVEEHAARAFSRRMRSHEFLQLHAEEGPVAATTRLKIAAGVFIHEVHGRLDHRPLRAALTVTEGTISAATLDPSAGPARRTLESSLVGTPLDCWEQRVAELLPAAMAAMAEMARTEPSGAALHRLDDAPTSPRRRAWHPPPFRSNKRHRTREQEHWPCRDR